MAAALQRPSIDRLGALLGAVGALAVVLAPFLVLKANRLAAGTPHSVLEALPGAAAWPLLLLLKKANKPNKQFDLGLTRRGNAIYGAVPTG